MKYTTIRIEGAILSADILDKIEQGELGGQHAKDFGFDTMVKVKDEIPEKTPREAMIRVEAERIH